MLNTFSNESRVVSIELFSAAWCNLDCTYCYIPKHTDFAKSKHNEIIEKVITKAKNISTKIKLIKSIKCDN